MGATEIERVAAFYDGIAEDYDAVLAADDENRRVRECFWAMADAVLHPHSRVLDYGAGTGIDARRLARMGHEVVAYDISAGMLRALAQRCAAEIESGRIRPVVGPPDLLGELFIGEPFTAIVSNFAVLSTISSLRPLFRLWASVTEPGARVLVTVQNPWNAVDARTAAFWRGLLAIPRTGAIRYRSAETGASYRHLLTRIRSVAAPAFRPIRNPGSVAECSAVASRFGRFRIMAFERT